MRWLDAENPVPALLVRPRGAASLDEARLAVEQWEHYARKRLDNAQGVVVELMMAEGRDRRWAARTTGRAEPRQNGKGDEIEVVEAWGLTQRGEAIVHTAHEIPTAKSAHERMDSDGFAFVEHSAERVELNRDGRAVSTPPDVEDRAAWARANPAYGVRIEEVFLKEQLRTLGPDLFAREHLGVWDPCNDGQGFLPYGKWLAAADKESTVTAGLAYGLSVAPDGSWAAVGSAGRRRDGRFHVDSVRYEHGTGWVVDYLADLYSRKRIPVHVNPEATEGAFIRALSDRKVPVVEVGHRDYKQACGAFLAALENDRLRHIDQEALNRSVAAADRRDVGHEGGWVWERPQVDISPLVAATLALSGVTEGRRPKIHVLQEV
jgi:hypothetical protein